jgi:hypothetical protein
VTVEAIVYAKGNLTGKYNGPESVSWPGPRDVVALLSAAWLPSMALEAFLRLSHL